MNAYVDSVDSPAGRLTFAVDEGGALLRTQFVDGSYRRSMEQELRRERFTITADAHHTETVRTQLLEYAAGKRGTFDLPLVLNGDDWQVAVWRALLQIPFGETRCYRQIAVALGHPAAAREVGQANATNRLPLVVPCHRVIGADGSLKGFAGGVHIKQHLLAHEGAMLRFVA